MVSRHVYRYYMKDLLVCDMNSVTTILKYSMPECFKYVVEDHVNNYKTVIALGYARSLEGVEEILEKVRGYLREFNAVLDKYHVTEELRFDLDDLPDAIAFHRLLFSYMPEDECERAIENRRQRQALKGKK